MPALDISSFEEGTSVKTCKMTFFPCLDQFLHQQIPLLRLSRTLLNIICSKINFPFLTDSDNPLHGQKLLNVFFQKALTYLLTV